MIGTIVNTCAIIAGSLLGALLHQGVKEKYKEVLYTGLGLASLAIGLNATISHLPKSEYPVLFILSLAIGGVEGTVVAVDAATRRESAVAIGTGETRINGNLLHTERETVPNPRSVIIIIRCIHFI